jgi:peptidoglycan biosynthesis protein MviN/MurJ (putative lipid II flippase)
MIASYPGPEAAILYSLDEVLMLVSGLFFFTHSVVFLPSISTVVSTVHRIF